VAAAVTLDSFSAAGTGHVFWKMNTKVICVVGSGDVGKGLVVVFTRIGMNVVFVGSGAKVPEVTNYFGEEVLDVELKERCICSSYEELHKHEFDYMVITYPHLAITDRFPQLFQKGVPPSCKAIYFMFAFGSAMLSIPTWVSKVNTASWIIGNFSLLHAKTTEEGVNTVTKMMPGQYYSFETTANMPATAEFMATMRMAGFDLQPTSRAMDIFLNCKFYSNMIWHPCLWLVRFQQGLACSHSIHGDKDFLLYGTISTASWNAIYDVWSDVKRLGNAIDGLGCLVDDLPIHALSKAGGFPVFRVVDRFLERHLNTRKWPFLSQFYKGDSKVKTKHFERDVCEGLNMCRHLARHLGIQVPHIQVLCDTYRGLDCFKDSKLWNLYDQTDFGEVVESYTAVQRAQRQASTMNKKALVSSKIGNPGMLICALMFVTMLTFVSGVVHSYSTVAW